MPDRGSDEWKACHVTLAPEFQLPGCRSSRPVAGAGRDLSRRRRGRLAAAAIDACAAPPISSGPGNVESPALGRVEQPADVIFGARHRRAGLRFRIDTGACCRGQDRRRQRRTQRQRVARLADVAAGEGGRLAPCAGPAIEDMLPDLRRPWPASAPSAARHNRRDNASPRRPTSRHSRQARRAATCSASLPGVRAPGAR